MYNMTTKEQDSYERTGNEKPQEHFEYVLRLFVTGASSNSLRAISNIKEICETHIAGKYSLEIIDVYQQKFIAETEQLIALPLLIKIQPLPKRRLIGDMSNTAKVLLGLGL